jgi:hypothetical protein
VRFDGARNLVTAEIERTDETRSSGVDREGNDEQPVGTSEVAPFMTALPHDVPAVGGAAPTIDLLANLAMAVRVRRHDREDYDEDPDHSQHPQSAHQPTSPQRTPNQTGKMRPDHTDMMHWGSD